jgi:hypothetical protein
MDRMEVGAMAVIRVVIGELEVAGRVRVTNLSSVGSRSHAIEGHLRWRLAHTKVSHEFLPKK